MTEEEKQAREFSDKEADNLRKGLDAAKIIESQDDKNLNKIIYSSTNSIWPTDKTRFFPKGDLRGLPDDLK